MSWRVSILLAFAVTTGACKSDAPTPPAPTATTPTIPEKAPVAPPATPKVAAPAAATPASPPMPQSGSRLSGQVAYRGDPALFRALVWYFEQLEWPGVPADYAGDDELDIFEVGACPFLYNP